MKRITSSLIVVISVFLLSPGCTSESKPPSPPIHSAMPSQELETTETSSEEIIPTMTFETPVQEAVSTEIYSDLAFAESTNSERTTQVLDVYKPTGSGTWPIVVFLHGINTNKEGHANESITIAENGAVVFTPTLPIKIQDIAAMGEGEGFREIYEAIACTIRFARTNASQYGGDPTRLVLVGFSYGAAYGSWIALGGDTLENQWVDFMLMGDGPPPQIECVENEGSIVVDAFLGISGRYNFAEKFKDHDPVLWEIASSYAHIGINPELPIRLLHGEQDTTVNPDISAELNELLVEAGYDTRLTYFDGIHQVPIDLMVKALLELTEN